MCFELLCIKKKVVPLLYKCATNDTLIIISALKTTGYEPWFDSRRRYKVSRDKALY